MSARTNNNKSSQQKKNPVELNVPVEKKSFLLKSIPLYIFLLLCIVPACSLGFYFHFVTSKKSASSGESVADQHQPNVKVVRRNEQSLVHPLLFVDIEGERALNPVKIRVEDYLSQKNNDGSLTSASIFLKDLNSGLYFNINPDSLYDPASLIKVPLLIICLKQAETNPAFLKKTFKYTRNPAFTTVELIRDKSLIEGKNYSVEELLQYMIVYSDNEAYWLLSEQIDPGKIDELNAELQIPNQYDVLHYPEKDKHIITGVRSVAHYFNVLYNASYLNKNMSAYALDLLTKSTFKNGLVKNMQADLTVAHKFGERTVSYMKDGRLENLHSEFHEFGIIYQKNRPYLLGIMTRGAQSEKLQAAVSDISGIVFDELKAQ